MSSLAWLASPSSAVAKLAAVWESVHFAAATTRLNWKRYASQLLVLSYHPSFGTVVVSRISLAGVLCMARWLHEEREAMLHVNLLLQVKLTGPVFHSVLLLSCPSLFPPPPPVFAAASTSSASLLRRCLPSDQEVGAHSFHRAGDSLAVTLSDDMLGVALLPGWQLSRRKKKTASSSFIKRRKPWSVISCMCHPTSDSQCNKTVSGQQVC